MGHRQVPANRVGARFGQQVVPSDHISAPINLDALTRAKNDHGAALWQACHDYEYQFFSGGAHALLLKLQVVAPGTPLAAMGSAVEAWIVALWKDYYQRKAVLWSAETPEVVAAVSDDFSNHGDPPYTIGQIMAALPG